MRTITKNISLPVDGERREFRLTKLDAFSGAALLRLIRRHLPAESLESASADQLPDRIFSALTDAELRALMTSCLNHTEVLLEAGYQPVMTGEDWGYPELSHDAGTCLRLTLQSVLWTLHDFFGDGGSISRSAPPSA